jgi:hypothetical protein
VPESSIVRLTRYLRLYLLMMGTDIYVGMELAVVPVFQSEIVPPPVRGLAVGTYQMSINVEVPVTLIILAH